MCITSYIHTDLSPTGAFSRCRRDQNTHTHTQTLIINVKETRAGRELFCAVRNNQAVWRVSLMKCVSTARAQKSHSLNHFINITERTRERHTWKPRRSADKPASQTTRAWWWSSSKLAYLKHFCCFRNPSTGALQKPETETKHIMKQEELNLFKKSCCNY